MCLSHSELFAEALCSGDYSRCLAELELVPVSTLWPKNSTLRALASLLTADDPRVNEVAADYLSSGASHGHFRSRVSGAKERPLVHWVMTDAACQVWICVCLQAVECYTQALSEAGGQSQRAACSALSRLQVSGLLLVPVTMARILVFIWTIMCCMYLMSSNFREVVVLSAGCREHQGGGSTVRFSWWGASPRRHRNTTHIW